MEQEYLISAAEWVQIRSTATFLNGLINSVKQKKAESRNKGSSPPFPRRYLNNRPNHGISKSRSRSRSASPRNRGSPELGEHVSNKNKRRRSPRQDNDNKNERRKSYLQFNLPNSEVSVNDIEKMFSEFGSFEKKPHIWLWEATGIWCGKVFFTSPESVDRCLNMKEHFENSYSVTNLHVPEKKIPYNRNNRYNASINERTEK